MKRIIIFLISVFFASAALYATNDKVVSLSELPVKAQTMIKKHFPNQTVSFVKMDRDWLSKSYEVVFSNGDKIEFDKSGDWMDIDCEYTAVPTELIPARIMAQVSANYSGQKVTKIEKKRRGRYEVELSNQIELTFDKNFKLIELDR
ncbi:hypothetical protein HR11_08685 [Porphyromonas macacae]|uniref:PepSY-like domain-containing protein n=1 Tax=Porphyromonas macacae TaxID=28115 RepID=UPI00052D2609|nr:PepSY-like domain-containing protein [Porphyromonas macacae]KGN98599.1 hypothetical protein HR11_08685 [Porphyromonas macacae]